MRGSDIYCVSDSFGDGAGGAGENIDLLVKKISNYLSTIYSSHYGTFMEIVPVLRNRKEGRFVLNSISVSQKMGLGDGSMTSLTELLDFIASFDLFVETNYKFEEYKK